MCQLLLLLHLQHQTHSQVGDTSTLCPLSRSLSLSRCTRPPRLRDQFGEVDVRPACYQRLPEELKRRRLSVVPHVASSSLSSRPGQRVARRHRLVLTDTNESRTFCSTRRRRLSAKTERLRSRFKSCSPSFQTHHLVSSLASMLIVSGRRFNSFSAFSPLQFFSTFFQPPRFHSAKPTDNKHIGQLHLGAYYFESL